MYVCTDTTCTCTYTCSFILCALPVQEAKPDMCVMVQKREKIHHTSEGGREMGREGGREMGAHVHVTIRIL